MSDKGDALRKKFIDKVFAGIDFAPGTDLWISLHTAAPGNDGDQTTNETSYGNYARQSLAVGAGWNTSSNQASNAAEVTFPASSDAGQTITHFAIGTSQTGVGEIRYQAAVTSNLVIQVGTEPKFPIGNLVALEE